MKTLIQNSLGKLANPQTQAQSHGALRGDDSVLLVRKQKLGEIQQFLAVAGDGKGTSRIRTQISCLPVWHLLCLASSKQACPELQPSRMPQSCLVQTPFLPIPWD